ncbi:MAG: SDR family NAD(P)-dependent oxidoreductase [Pseudomonadota bacterium]
MKTILITGASSGIGQALALHYAQSGAILFLTGRDAGRLADVADQCRIRGARAVHAATVNVTDVTAMTTQCTQWDDMSPIDIVIANAGISGGAAGMDTETTDQARQIFAVNLGGVLNTLAPVLPRLQARQSGHVVVISSLAAHMPLPGAPAYSASKAAVGFYGQALAGMLSGSGVRVSVVYPGFVVSRMTAVNNFAMPFLMPADRAAQIIVKGIAKGQTRIYFPWAMAGAVRLASILPARFLAFMTRLLPRKAALSRDDIQADVN